MDYANTLRNLLRTMRSNSTNRTIAELWIIFDQMQDDESEPETAPDDMMMEFEAVYYDR
jgi:hypothetical protein